MCERVKYFIDSYTLPRVKLKGFWTTDPRGENPEFEVNTKLTISEVKGA